MKFCLRQRNNAQKKIKLTGTNTLLSFSLFQFYQHAPAEIEGGAGRRIREGEVLTKQIVLLQRGLSVGSSLFMLMLCVESMSQALELADKEII